MSVKSLITVAAFSAIGISMLFPGIPVDGSQWSAPLCSASLDGEECDKVRRISNDGPIVSFQDLSSNGEVTLWRGNCDTNYAEIVDEKKFLGIDMSFGMGVIPGSVAEAKLEHACSFSD